MGSITHGHADRQELRAGVRLWARIRWCLAAYAVVGLPTYEPSPGTRSVISAWGAVVVVVGLLVVTNLVVLASRRGSGLPLAAALGLAVDLVTAATLTALAAPDPAVSVWVLFVVPVLEAAVLGRLVGALVAWALSCAGVVLAALLGATSGVPPAPESAVFRCVVLLLVALVAGTQASSLHRLVRQSEAARATSAHQADHDDLTGLPSRGRALRELREALAVAGPDGDVVRVLFCDLDRFKAVNDTWGHDAGDAVLVQVAARLRGVVRPGDLAARLSGDEFVVLARRPAATPTSDDEAHCQELAAALAGRYVLPGGGDAHLRASVGVARARPRDADGDVLRRADEAMYACKRGPGLTGPRPSRAVPAAAGTSPSRGQALAPERPGGPPPGG